MSNKINVENELVSSSKWNSFSLLLKYITLISSIIITARVAGPSDFGIVATTGSIISLFIMLSSFGFGQAIVGLKKIDREYYDTLLTISLCFAVLIYLLIFLISKPLSIYFANPIIEKILLISAISIFFTMSASIPRSIIERKLGYKNIVFIDISNNFISLLVIIYMALYFRSIWILIIPQIIAQFTSMIVAFTLSKYVPRLKINLRKFKLSMNFALSSFLSTLCNYASKNLIIFFGAKAFGFHQLGLFTFASSKTEKPIDIIGGVMIPQFFPIISKIFEEKEKVREISLNMIKYISLISSNAYLFLIVSSPLIFPFLFTEKWNESIILFQYLCIIQILRGYMLPSNSVLYALKLPHISARVTAIRLGFYILITLSFIFFQLSILSTVIMIVLADAIICVIYLSEFLKSIESSFYEYFKYVKKIILVTMLLFIIYFICNFYISSLIMSNILVDLFSTIIISLLILIFYRKEINIIFNKLSGELFNF